jgi:hypothetical protein
MTKPTIPIEVEKTQHGLSISFPDRGFSREKEIERVRKAMIKKDFQIVALVHFSDTKLLAQMSDLYDYSIVTIERLPEPYEAWSSNVLVSKK